MGRDSRVNRSTDRTAENNRNANDINPSRTGRTQQGQTIAQAATPLSGAPADNFRRVTSFAAQQLALPAQRPPAVLFTPPANATGAPNQHQPVSLRQPGQRQPAGGAAGAAGNDSSAIQTEGGVESPLNLLQRLVGFTKKTTVQGAQLAANATVQGLKLATQGAAAAGNTIVRMVKGSPNDSDQPPLGTATSPLSSSSNEPGPPSTDNSGALNRLDSFDSSSSDESVDSLETHGGDPNDPTAETPNRPTRYFTEGSPKPLRNMLGKITKAFTRTQTVDTAVQTGQRPEFEGAERRGHAAPRGQRPQTSAASDRSLQTENVLGSRQAGSNQESSEVGSLLGFRKQVAAVIKRNQSNRSGEAKTKTKNGIIGQIQSKKEKIGDQIDAFKLKFNFMRGALRGLPEKHLALTPEGKQAFLNNQLYSDYQRAREEFSSLKPSTAQKASQLGKGAANALLHAAVGSALTVALSQLIAAFMQRKQATVVPGQDETGVDTLADILSADQELDKFLDSLPTEVKDVILADLEAELKQVEPAQRKQFVSDYIDFLSKSYIAALHDPDEVVFGEGPAVGIKQDALEKILDSSALQAHENLVSSPASTSYPVEQETVSYAALGALLGSALGVAKLLNRRRTKAKLEEEAGMLLALRQVTEPSQGQIGALKKLETLHVLRGKEGAEAVNQATLTVAGEKAKQTRQALLQEITDIRRRERQADRDRTRS